MDCDTIDPKLVAHNLSACLKVVSKFYRLLNADIVNFFCEFQWDLLPDSWQCFLETLSASQLASIVDCNNDCAQVEMPHSLRKTRTLIKKLSLERKSMNLEDSFRSNSKSLIASLSYKCKQKKFAEIEAMGKLCYETFSQENVDCLIDIGSGLGHLSRCLAYVYNIPVIGIEMDPQKTETAKLLDTRFCRKMKGLQTLRHHPFHITKEITPQATIAELNQLINEYFPISNCKFGLIGLHPCGDLATTMLRFFAESKNCRFLHLASCCYNKMTTDVPLNKPETALALSERQLSLSLHANENFQKRLIENRDSFKADYFRALTEKVIAEKVPHLKEIRRRNVCTGSASGISTFSEYLRQSLKEVELSEEVARYAEELEDQMKFQRVVAVICIKNMFAPLLETTVLLDRLLQLQQLGEIKAQIVQCFDPNISPRVHVIKAVKYLS